MYVDNSISRRRAIILTTIVASSRRSVSRGAAQKTGAFFFSRAVFSR